MNNTESGIAFDRLRDQLEGDLFLDYSWRLMYATDASVFKELPVGVCRPANESDLEKILAFCREHKLPVIPRTAGTSLAGQVVGHGLVVDFSRYMNEILELNVAERWVRVQPGVILDDLNRYLAPHGLFFAPETSTSNRCMIAGMVANNSCGSHSLVYGSTRDHTLEIKAMLYDGSTAVFGDTDADTFQKKCVGSKLENKIYSGLFEMLSKKENREEIVRNYPDPGIKRRNTGYALDLLLKANVFGGEEAFNMCRLLCGAEGTLAFYTEIKLNLVPLPPPETALLCVHLDTVEDALQANLIALKYKPVAVELIDKVILDCTKANIGQRKNRFFLEGDPGAILVVEFACDTSSEVDELAGGLEAHLRREALGFHYPLLRGGDINKVWNLRKAGLGLLSNMPGDAKPVAVIEDNAVHVEVLPMFIKEVLQLLDKLSLKCVFFAHIGTGEIHIRPIVNLKSRADVERFYQVAEGTAHLVKKYKGSLSGEHGDGRLRAGFIPLVIGEKNYELLREVKKLWDPLNIMNPGKIIDPPSMKTSLRYLPGQPEKKLTTYFNYDKTLGFLRAVEQCNGSGDCRKPPAAGGVMCPSYHATLNEFDSTRGRANLLREFVTNSSKKNPFDHKELIDVLDLCLSCKGCKSECPSSVDVGKYKAETLQHYYDANGTPFGARVTGAYAKLNKLGSLTPQLFNFMATQRLSSALIKRMLGFAKQRSLPLLHRHSLRKWARKQLPALNRKNGSGKMVYLFCDEFTNFNDTQTGIHAVLLLHHLGYRVEIPVHDESGRTYLSKGLLKKAKKVIGNNIRQLSGLVSAETPLVGIEPSAILGFRDEYLELADAGLLEAAQALSENAFTIEEFIVKAHENGEIDAGLFTKANRKIYLHGHCHQKALSSIDYGHKMLSIPSGTEVRNIDCGCCGMAGAFGYEKDHYEISMKIGELSLFPAVRQAEADALIVAAGTSCRHQIKDGTGREALHPADALYHCLVL
ncbi:MAG: FAD-linked oxidase C-terminal domain-containing protein [Bacteroidales bacterium]|nr:FAD-linked oxidase C-terminal domain-containing protein [Bacteroidales bacterium]